MYSGTLIGMLAVPAYEKPINSLWDLRDAMASEGHTFGLMGGSATSHLFAVGIHQKQDMNLMISSYENNVINYINNLVKGDKKLC